MTDVSEGSPLLAGPLAEAQSAFKRARTRKGKILAKAAMKESNEEKAKRMSEIVDEIEREAANNNTGLWYEALLVFFHFSSGVLFMSVMERWSIVDSLYFTIVVTTTVGYGDITPQHWYSKLFVCYYIIVAIAIISSVLATLVGNLIDGQEELLVASITGTIDADQQREEDEEAMMPLTSARGFSRFMKDWSQVMFTGMFLVIVLIAGFVVFHVVEGLSVVDSIYVTVISATTVGFGDIDPSKRSSRLIMIVWLLVATLSLAKVISDQSETVVHLRQRNLTRMLLEAKMDRTTLVRMDKNNDGKVSRAEFLVSCLLRLRKVEKPDLDEILERFDELDVDNSGFITLEDVDSNLL